MYADYNRSILGYIKQWLWPTYRRPDVSGLFVKVEQAPTVRAKKQEDPYKFAGYNEEGSTVKAKVFDWSDAQGSTTWSDTKTMHKGQAKRADVVEHLTAHDEAELAKRKPVVSKAAATVIKAAYHAKGGAVYSSELQDVTGYSKAYCDVCLAAFRSALSIERGETEIQH